MTTRFHSAIVTGGAGFIGSELVRQLADRGVHVTIVDNLVNGKRENVEAVLGERVRLEVQDIRNIDAMRKLLRGVDVVFHLACLGVRHSLHSPEENNAVNATATLDLLRESRAAGIGRFVYVSSSEIYGTAKFVPMTEDHPPWPMTVYGAGKLAGECHTRAYHRTYGFPTVVIRPFNAFGPRSHHEGDSGEVIPKFILRTLAGRPMIVYGDGTQTRDFTYVADTARGILTIGVADSAVGETFNLGTGREVSILDLAREIARVTGRGDARVEHHDPRPGDVLRLCCDMSRARAETGFETKIPLAEGLRLLLEWYRASGVPAEQLLADEVPHNWMPLRAEAQP